MKQKSSGLSVFLSKIDMNHLESTNPLIALKHGIRRFLAVGAEEAVFMGLNAKRSFFKSLVLGFRPLRGKLCSHHLQRHRRRVGENKKRKVRAEYSCERASKRLWWMWSCLMQRHGSILLKGNFGTIMPFLTHLLRLE